MINLIYDKEEFFQYAHLSKVCYVQENILSNRNAHNIDTLPKYMTSLCRKECSAMFRYKCRMLDVKGNFPGGLENILCSYCDTGTETQIHIMQECPHFIEKL